MHKPSHIDPSIFHGRQRNDAFRVEPAVAQPAPPQTRTCAINASGSSVARVLARLWHITMLPCKPPQMLWTILGVGRT
jgi:hypothetical protein